MNSLSPLLSYVLKANIVLVALYLFYQLALKWSTGYSLNRAYFILSVLASLTLPLIASPLTPPWAASEGLAEQQLLLNTVQLPTLAALNAQPVSSSALSFSSAATAVLAAGVLFLLTRMLIRLASIRRITRKSKARQLAGYQVRVVNEAISPFSFLNTIYVNPALYSEHELGIILAHERSHVSQKHSLDMLLFELCCCCFWFNPFAWLMRKSAMQNLEYLADRSAIRAGICATSYQYLLLKTVACYSVPLPASEFKMSNLKKRIVMINKAKTSQLSLLRHLFVLPLLATLWLLTAPVAAQEKKESKVAYIILSEDEQASSDTTSLPKHVVATKNKHVVLTVKGTGSSSDTSQHVTSSIHVYSTSRRSDSQPVLYVDGVKCDSNMLTTLPDSIKSITVLKDAKAVEAYGEEAKSGVLLISTKEVDSSRLKNVKVIRMSNPNHSGAVFYDGKEVAYDSINTIDPNAVKTITVLKGSAAKAYGSKGKDGVTLISTHLNEKPGNINLSSFGGLVVIDGVVADKSTLQNINPATIKSMNILKDKAASSMYGKKGKNGVIEIATKSSAGKATITNIRTHSLKSKSEDVTYYIDDEEVDEKKVESLSADRIKSINVDKKEDGKAAIKITLTK